MIDKRHTTTVFRTLTAALLLSVLVLSARAQAQGDKPLKLENRLVEVEIDRTSGAVRSIHDKELNNTYAFAGIGFEVTTATGTIRSIKALDADVKGGESFRPCASRSGLSVGYGHPLQVVKWFTDAGVNFNNGASFAGYVNHALEEAKASMTPAEIATMGDLTQVQSAIKAPAEARAFVKEWTTAELQPLLNKVGKERNFARGKAAFASAQCILCHRYGDQGGSAGPDLTNVATRFKRQDLLESITEPSKVLSEQYMMSVFTMKDGAVTAGRISQENDDTVVVMTNPFDPTVTMVISKADIKSRESSKVSLMPPGLLNTFKQDEILDLLAYLESMGDEKHPNFIK